MGRSLRAAAGSVALVVLLHGSAAAITLSQAGYSVRAHYQFQSATGRALAVDATGVLFAATANGIVKVLPDSTELPWSTTITSSLALSSAGDGYAIETSACNCIVQLDAGGAASTLVDRDTLSWVKVARAPDGTPWATGWVSGGRNGLYEIDPVSGEPALVVEGGPAPVSSTIYGDLAFDAYGTLFVLGTVYGTADDGVKVFRIDGSSPIQVASLPHGGAGIAGGNGSILYVATTYDYGSGYPIGEIWEVDAATGSTALLASTSSYDQIFWGMVYSQAERTLFVGETAKQNVLNYTTIWAITGGLLPVESATWGSVKARYRR